ncbi:MAG TPA: DUF397 domain-containing protein [Streptosporangiaceae bacterium]|nr:DUF397 domain-containing protein [Streptosporangiaceae bacterium]
MTATDMSRADWHKSSYSGQTGNCVEVATTLPGLVAVRDSQNRDGGVLRFSPVQWRELLENIKHS